MQEKYLKFLKQFFIQIFIWKETTINLKIVPWKHIIFTSLYFYKTLFVPIHTNYSEIL